MGIFIGLLLFAGLQAGLMVLFRKSNGCNWGKGLGSSNNDFWGIDNDKTEYRD